MTRMPVRGMRYVPERIESIADATIYHRAQMKRHRAVEMAHGRRCQLLWSCPSHHRHPHQTPRYHYYERAAVSLFDPFASSIHCRTANGFALSVVVGDDE